jgi:AcrR family transcriptional regulator
MTAASASGRRQYRSARRQQQAAETRSLVLAAATALFSEGGWSRTGMRDIAKRAGVAIETVYANFGSKSELLLTAIDVGVVGDTTPVPLSDRPEFAALGAGDRADRLATAARLLTGINQRSWGLRRAMSEAAVSEPQLEAKLHELEQRRRDNVRQGAEMVVRRPLDEKTLDALWVLMGADVFYLLTQIRGHSVEDYEEWLAHTLGRLLAEQPGGSA